MVRIHRLRRIRGIRPMKTVPILWTVCPTPMTDLSILCPLSCVVRSWGVQRKNLRFVIFTPLWRKSTRIIELLGRRGKYASLQRIPRSLSCLWYAQQSVRHHLSLSRLFERKAKPVTEPGFGSYWTVNLDAPPGTKRPRKRGRQNKGADSNQSGTPSATETIAGRRGRPKKYPPHDFEFEGTSGLPSTSSGHTSSAHSIAQTTSGGFATYHLPVNGCSSQQFRLHSIHDIPSTRLDDDDDDEKMIDIHDDYAEGRSQALSDDVDDSTDDHSVGPSTISCFSGDPRTVPPPSFSSLPVDPTLIINYSGSEQHISRLKDEVDELQGRITSLLTEKSRMERELSEARAEIARLRAGSEASE